jgi:hypothetical protein
MYNENQLECCYVLVQYVYHVYLHVYTISWTEYHDSVVTVINIVGYIPENSG